MTRALVLALALVAAPQLASAQVHVYVPGVRVNIAPPAARVEVRGVAPSGNHQWLGGHYAWRNGAHVWQGGHWALPPGSGYRYEPARWVNEGGRYVFFEGHWIAPQITVAEPVVATPPPPSEYVVQTAPPEPIIEVRPSAPNAGWVWLPGFWHWQNGRHMWVAGHWSPPQAGYAWEGARWQHFPNGWRMVPGHWRR